MLTTTSKLHPHGYLLLQIIALLVIVTGCGLRFYHLEHKLVWHDEVLTLTRVLGLQYPEVFDGVTNGQIQTPAQLLRLQHPEAGRGVMDVWNAIQEHPEHSPLYYVLAASAIHYLPNSPLLAMRGISALLSLLLFPAIFWLAWEWSRQLTVAWIATALIATSPLHLLYAQEAREYALLTVIIAAANAALLYALRCQKRRGWLIYSSILTIGIYTHLLFVHVLLAHALYLTWSAWKQPNIVSQSSMRSATLAFVGALTISSPWLLVLSQGAENLHKYTKWVGDYVVTIGELSHNWVLHINRIFIDLPMPDPVRVLLVAFLVLTLWWGLRKAPIALLRFLICLAAPVLVTIVLPDVLVGGIRSQETRYLMQLLIGIELATAWVIAQALIASKLWARISAGGLGMLLLLGFISQVTISRADSWWNKSISEENAAFAQAVNLAQRPLVLWLGTAECGFCAGELISLSYRLLPTVHILAATSNTQIDPHKFDYTDLFLLLPSEQTIVALKSNGYKVVPFAKSWKWFSAVPILQPAVNTASTLPTAIKAAIAVAPLLYDDFNTNPVNSKIWHLPTWKATDDGSFVGRTRFRCTQDSALSQTNKGNALITVESYNPLERSFYGTDLISNQTFTAGSGLSVKIRAKMNAPVQPGTVGGIFLYAMQPNSKTLHDEIDFEFIGNRPTAVSTNIYSNEPLGDGHAAFFPYKSGSMSDYHDYEIQWFFDKVIWLVDGVILRTDTSHIPTEPMVLHLNIWVPSKNWLEAHNKIIQPSPLPSTNQVFTMSVDSVTVQPLPFLKSK